MNWGTITLGDCVTLASGGTPSKREPLNWDGDIPWATTKDLKSDRLWDTDDHVTPLGASSGTRYVEEQTILISVRGMALANRLPLAMAMRRMTFNQDLKAISCKPNSDPRYIFYWLKANEATLLALADEAAHGTKRIQTDRLLSLELTLPSVESQRQIADTLSAYDDLIENNTRRIAILEEMVQRLYREWFVHFRYPGHESVPLVESDLGLIPKGWDILRLGDVVKLHYGKALKSEQRVAGPYPVYGSSGQVGWHSTALVEGPGVIVGRKGNIGSVYMEERSFYPIDTVYYATSDSPLTFVYHLLSNQSFTNNDSAVPGLNRDQAHSMKVTHPSRELIEQFGEIVENFVHHTSALGNLNSVLQSARGILLERSFSRT